MEPDNVLINALRAEAHRIEEDSIYSAKRHLNACDTWSLRHYVLGIPAALLAALVTTVLIKNYADLAQALATVSALLAALLTFLKPNDRASQHRVVGNQYLTLRNDARMFREIDLTELDDDSKKSEKLRQLAERRANLNASAPTTGYGAFKKARKGLEEGQASFLTDK